jgi:dolichol kinase
MADGLQAVLWSGILICGLFICVVLRKAGLATTYVRDLLHVGAGAWVFGWPFWHSAIAPICITAMATLGLLIIPLLARRVSLFARLEQAVSGEGERWSGLVLYAISFALMTWLSWRSSPFPAAAALFALALGDGIGGTVGRRYGRHFFAAPGGKRKSIEGSFAVAIAAAAGGWLAAGYFGVTANIWLLIGIGLVACAAEGWAPRASDNILLPAAVWLFVTVSIYFGFVRP